MPIEPPESALAALLPGTWTVVATNTPLWLAGDRLKPTYTFGLLREHPLSLSDDLSYQDRSGATRHVLGKDFHRDGGFLWRGRGLRALLPTPWQVTSVSEDDTIAVLRFPRRPFGHGGIDVLVREGEQPDDLRATIAHASAEFGLTAEDFASLSWLDWHVPRPQL